MIEEEAFVVCVEAKGYAWIETRGGESCHSCTLGMGCGAATLAKWVRPRPARIRVRDPINSQMGDTVVVGIDERAFLKGTFVVYMVPLICMIGAGLLVGYFAAGSTNQEVISILACLLGLVIGLMWLIRFGRKIARDSRYLPVVLRRKAPPQLPRLVCPTT